MLSYNTLLIFVPTITLLVIIPGPDFAVVSQISLFEGKRSGEWAAVGVTLGICLHTLFAMAGISAILAESAFLFSMLKLVGAAYLFYIGAEAIWKSRSEPKNANEISIMRKSLSGWRSLTTGFLTNALNPKAILYFMALYPQFLVPDKGVAPQFFWMGAITAIICLLWYLILANLLQKIRVLFAKWSFRKWLMRTTGAIFICFGIKLAVSE